MKTQDKDPRALSDSARALWAKTGATGQAQTWAPLYAHLYCTASVAAHLWDRLVSDHTKSIICNGLGLAKDDAKSLIWLCAGAHDIGKAAPGFCAKSELCELASETGLVMHEAGPDADKALRHAEVGASLFVWWATERFPTCDMGAIYVIASVIGAHHGASMRRSVLCNTYDATRRRLADHDFGYDDQAWADAQNELLDFIASCTDASVMGRMSLSDAVNDAIVLVTDIVCYADWIASNENMFELRGHVDDLVGYVREGLDAIDLPNACQFVRSDGDLATQFARDFPDLPSGATIAPFQKKAMEMADSMDKPGVLMLEAPTGDGKTEAALSCAKVLAERFGLSGVAVALPTMATGNAMFRRLTSWVENIELASGDRTVNLIHSKANISDDLDALRNVDDHDRPYAYEWFIGSKKALLASFCATTIDQLLMAAYDSKHTLLRHLGLSNKVVVIDEIHAYDAHMGSYLCRLLAILGEYKVPVIMLSATLTPTARMRYIGAYNNPSMRYDDVSPYEGPTDEDGITPYPLITCATDNGTRFETCPPSKPTATTRIAFIGTSDEALVSHLEASIAGGGCACIVRNTVSRAQETYLMLRERLGDDVTLMHARISSCDRLAADQELLDLLGRDGDRPKRLVVVATQVVEQSLDIDFDVMFTDIAPIDLIIQRLGRLWRHARQKRPVLEPTLYLMGEASEDAPPTIDAGSTRVYDKSVLYRTCLSLMGRDAISVPDDVQRLVTEVYERSHWLPWPKAWAEGPSLDARFEEECRRQFDHPQSVCMLPTPVQAPDFAFDYVSGSGDRASKISECAGVRNNPAGICVVPVIETNGKWTVGGLRRTESPISRYEFGERDRLWPQAAKEVAKGDIALPSWCVAGDDGKALIARLEEDATRLGWREKACFPLAHTYPLVLDETHTATIGRLLVAYDTDLGLSIHTSKGGAHGIICAEELQPR